MRASTYREAIHAGFTDIKPDGIGHDAIVEAIGSILATVIWGLIA